MNEALIAIMLAMITKEIPWIEKKPEKLAEYRADITKMVEVDRRWASRGLLVDARTDRLLLGAIRFFEARFSSQPRDGDCSFVRRHLSEAQKRALRDPKTRLLPAWATQPQRVCNAVGPMQVSRTVRVLVQGWPEYQQLGLPQKLTVEQMRDPELGVGVGYSVLSHWKKCGGPPGVWITAYGWGKCPPKHPRTDRVIDFEGKRRCKKVAAFMTALEEKGVYQRPQGWWCGPEKKPDDVQSP